MKRCLQIVAALHIGGAEKVARDIGLSCRKNGYEVDYLLFGETAKGYDDELESSGCRLIHIPSPSNGYLRFYRQLRQLIRENRYDVVHAHTMFSIGWAMLAAEREGVPVRVAHAHSALNNGSSLKKRAYERIMRRLILNHATDLVACGDAAGIRLYGSKAYRKRGRRILNGIDVEAFAYDPAARREIRQSLGLEDDYVIGHVGRLSSEKNQAFLIRLLPQILEKKQNAKLLLLGDGSDRRKLERLTRDTGLTDRVIMTGNVRNVEDYLSAMDVFAFPSLFEGMPLSIVEVQANGLPCILSTGVPKDVFLTDLIRQLPLDDPDEWVKAICGAERTEPLRYSSELCQKGFDSDAVMKKYMDLYERGEK